jgi:hypothetical protein
MFEVLEGKRRIRSEDADGYPQLLNPPPTEVLGYSEFGADSRPSQANGGVRMYTVCNYTAPSRRVGIIISV